MSRIQQRGVALAYLLWMLAGLSLLVSGVVTQSVTDVRATGRQLDEARVRAAGIGAANMLLSELRLARADGGYDGRSLYARRFQLAGHQIEARAIPLAGLISLNQAPETLLRGLFQHGAGLVPGDAAVLAEAVVDWRAAVRRSSSSTGGRVPFRVTEDLLRVPGVTRSVYDSVRSQVHAELGGAAGIDPMAAPVANLRVVARGDAALADELLALRENAGFAAGLPAGLESGFLGAGRSVAYCLEVNVQMAEGHVLQQRLWVSMKAGADGAPWRFDRVEPVESVGRG